MKHPILFVIGCSMLGWLLPEVLTAFKLKVSAAMNFFAAIAVGLIAAAFVW